MRLALNEHFDTGHGLSETPPGGEWYFYILAVFQLENILRRSSKDNLFGVQLTCCTQ